MRDFSQFTDAGLKEQINKLQSKADHARKCGRVVKAARLTQELITARIERMRRCAKRKSS